jgi:hypothetical protein
MLIAKGGELQGDKIDAEREEKRRGREEEER